MILQNRWLLEAHWDGHTNTEFTELTSHAFGFQAGTGFQIHWNPADSTGFHTSQAAPARLQATYLTKAFTQGTQVQWARGPSPTQRRLCICRQAGLQFRTRKISTRSQAAATEASHRRHLWKTTASSLRLLGTQTQGRA